MKGQKENECTFQMFRTKYYVRLILEDMASKKTFEVSKLSGENQTSTLAGLNLFSRLKR